MAVVHDGLPGGDGRLLEIATAAHLSRYQGESRAHTESDLRVFLGWCVGQDLDPFEVRRVDIEAVSTLAAKKPAGSSHPPSHAACPS
jgi:hypothetical protein